MQKKSIIGVYGILAVVLGMYYVGSTDDVEKGWKRERLPRLRRGKFHSKVLQAAFKEYGEENVKFILLEEVTDVSKLPEKEKFWQREFKSGGLLLNPRISGTPGMRGKRHSDESRKRMSDAKTGGERRWVFLSPDGQVFAPDILSDFCREQGLRAGAMSRVASGKQRHHKRWTKFA